VNMTERDASPTRSAKLDGQLTIDNMINKLLVPVIRKTLPEEYLKRLQLPSVAETSVVLEQTSHRDFTVDRRGFMIEHGFMTSTPAFDVYMLEMVETSINPAIIRFLKEEDGSWKLEFSHQSEDKISIGLIRFEQSQHGTPLTK